MKCDDTKIKELLPLCLERELDGAELKQVELHLASCEECRTEFSLLQMVSEEPVPDPGEAFWAAMPERVARDVRGQQKRTLGLSGLLDALFTHRGAWATAAVCVLAVVLWSVQRDPVNMVAFTEEETAVQDMDPDTEAIVKEFSARELETAVQWAQNEFEPIRDALDEQMADPNQQISDDLLKLDERELDRFYDALEKKEQEIQNRIRKKMENRKNTG